MRFCFIVEEQYRNDPMPMVIADQLLQWGHDVDLLEPQTAVTCLSDLAQQGYDAYVLKSLADGPGLSILEAAEAVGIPTINNSRSIPFVPLTPRVRKLFLQVGKLFGRDIYGVDVVETPRGPEILDINAFPSFGRVPRAVVRVSEYVLHAAKRAEIKRAANMERARQRREALEAKKAKAATIQDRSVKMAGSENVESGLAGCNR